MKKKSLTLLFAVVVMMNCFELVQPVIATPDPPATNCKWLASACPHSGAIREICVIDGDGKLCVCGDVTRSCD